MSSSSPIPDGYHTVTPSLTIKGADKALEFYKKAFGAIEQYRLPAPDGTIMHAEFKIGNSTMMLSDEFPSWGALSPETIGGSPSSYLIYVPDADNAIQQALEAGATLVMPASDQFWGDRMGSVKDPYGYKWSLASRKETLSEDEVKKRFAIWMEKNKSNC